MKMSDCFFFALLTGFALILLIHAQDQSGFISIDCGSSYGYTDITTRIEYVTDATFIDTGISKSVSAEYRTYDNAQLLLTLRSFPEGIRNCYNVRLKRGNKYLIRATFSYGNYDGLGQAPQFDLHLGANMWDSVSLGNDSIITIKEIIHLPSSNFIYVCLVNTGLGIPLISGLEFRLLKNTTYVTQSGSLDLFYRIDVASTTYQTVRFEEDVYDRIWEPYHYPMWAELSTMETIDAGGSNDFQPPPIIMRTAATPKNENDPLDLVIIVDDPAAEFYVYMHFAELVELQANQSRSFNISFNDGIFLYGSVVPDYLSTSTIYTPKPLSEVPYQFSIYKTENSTLPPIINAIELYTVKDLFQSETVQEDVDAILNIKSMYGLKKDWQGDPCSPQAYMWDGLNCSYNAYDPPRIISLNLSSSGLSGKMAPYLSNLTMLQSLDLSNNNLTGPVPEFLAQLLSLTVLNLQGNMLTGSVPDELIKRSKNGLLSLSDGGNPNLCSSISCNKKNTTVVVPILALVAILSVLIIALATLLVAKRRKQRVGKVDAKSNQTSKTLESKSRQFTYSQILSITNNLETVIGEGGFGKVYRGYLEGDKVAVAVKILSLSSRQGYSQFVAEVKLLLRVHHRNLTALIGYCDEDDSKIGLIYEYMANGDLAQHLSDSSTSILCWEGRLRIAMEAAQGLDYLHNGCKPPIVHRDVKTTNILLNEKFQAKLADFGLSKSFPIEDSTHVSHLSTGVAGTHGYLDPEYCRTRRLSEKSDVYSFGVVLLVIITCQPVFANTEGNSHISEWVSDMLSSGDIKNIVDPRLQGDFDTNSVWKAVEIAMTCVSQSSTRRPTMNHVVMELKECLGMELRRRRGGHETESQGLSEMFTANIELAPLAR